MTYGLRRRKNRDSPIRLLIGFRKIPTKGIESVPLAGQFPPTVVVRCRRKIWAFVVFKLGHSRAAVTKFKCFRHHCLATRNENVIFAAVNTSGGHDFLLKSPPPRVPSTLLDFAMMLGVVIYGDHPTTRD